MYKQAIIILLDMARGSSDDSKVRKQRYDAVHVNSGAPPSHPATDASNNTNASDNLRKQPLGIIQQIPLSPPTNNSSDNHPRTDPHPFLHIIHAPAIRPDPAGADLPDDNFETRLGEGTYVGRLVRCEVCVEEKETGKAPACVERCEGRHGGRRRGRGRGSEFPRDGVECVGDPFVYM